MTRLTPTKVLAPVPKTLEEMGFKRPSTSVPRRLVCSVEGLDKTGKTHLALTADPPVAYISIDAGSEGVIEHFTGKDILQYEVRMRGLNVDSRTQEDYAALWTDTRAALRKALSMGVGTVVIDTASEAYELCRLAHFGKLSNVMPHNYTQVNAEWREMIRWGYDSGINLILIHKLKPKWVNNARTADYEVAGMSEIAYLVQACISMVRTGEGPKTELTATIRSCRQNLFASGVTVPWPMLKEIGFEAILEEVHS